MRVAVDAKQTVIQLLPRNAVGVEIGVWKGDLSARLLSAARPKTLHLVDPWVAMDQGAHREAWYGAEHTTQQGMDEIADSVTQRFDERIVTQQVQIHRGYSRDVLAQFADSSMDFVYIDGDHSFDGVSADIEAAVRITRVGGLICCDDYSLGSWWQDGVVRAVHQGLHEHPLILVLKVNNQVVMRRIER